MSELIRIELSGSAANATGDSRCAAAGTLAGWQAYIAAWATDARASRAMLDAAREFWTSTALLVERREDVSSTIRACVNYAMDQAQGPGAMSVALLTERAVFWGHTVPGGVRFFAKDAPEDVHWENDRPWREGVEALDGLDGLMLLPPGAEQLSETALLRRLDAALREASPSRETAGPAIYALWFDSPAPQAISPEAQAEAEVREAQASPASRPDTERPLDRREQPREPEERSRGPEAYLRERERRNDERPERPPRREEAHSNGLASHIVEGLKSLFRSNNH